MNEQTAKELIKDLEDIGINEQTILELIKDLEDIRINKQTVIELIKCTELNTYFLNGLFAVLLQELQDEKKVSKTSLFSTSNSKYKLYISQETMKRILRCSKKLDFIDFAKLCKEIKNNILNKRLIEIKPYINKALIYLEQQDFTNGKMTKSKIYRKEILEQVSTPDSESYILEQEREYELVQDEQEYKKIIEVFSDLTMEELSLLYRVADVFPYTQGYDSIFMEQFSLLNEKGQSLFREAIETEYNKQNSSVEDEVCKFCQIITRETETNILDITPEMLYKKMLDIGFCSLEYAEEIKIFRNTNLNIWKILGIFHQLILIYANKNTKDLAIEECNSLLILLSWLVQIPSLKITHI